MGCPSVVDLGNNLTFTVTTHDPDTGVLTDADAVPDYRVYEDETATAILTGSMAKLDDANTTGFYAETLACTTANGFEHGKSYNIYIVATVDSDQGGICYGFKCRYKVGIQKNVALSNFEFLMIDSSDNVSPKTGLTITAQRSIDGAAFASCANSASELSNGMYKINLAAADLNGDVITLRFSATGANDRFITLKTQN
jgi:hypothetical protein